MEEDDILPPEDLLSVCRETRGGAVVLTVVGEVEYTTATRLREALD
jgi:hypothetical protein